MSTRAAVGQTSAVVTYAPPTTSGGVAPLITNCSQTSGASFDVGSTAVTCTATDAKASAASCTFSVTVDPAPIPRLAVTSFMAFGDSLTEGKVTRVPTIVLPNAYTLKLQAMLQARYSSQTIVITGEGLGGERAVDGIARFDAQLASDKPDAVLLMDGANDLLSGQASSIPGLTSALDTMGSHAAARGVSVLLATMPPVNPSGSRGAGAALVPDANARIVSLAATRGWTLVDVNAAFKGDLSLVGGDGLHLTDAGYQTVAQAFYDRIVGKFDTTPAVAGRPSAGPR